MLRKTTRRLGLLALFGMASPAAAGTLSLAWDPSQASVAGYVVSYGTLPGTYTTSIDVGSQTTYTITGLPDGQRLYLAVQAYDATGVRSVYSSEVNGFASVTAMVPSAPRAPTDIDGDARSDIAVWRPNTGYWYLLRSQSSYSHDAAQAIQWGGGWVGDIPVAGDYDGDGYTDIAVWRPAALSMFYILKSSTGYGTYSSVQWGGDGDVPVPADYDGDGTFDPAVWRPSTGIWYTNNSTGSGNLAVGWGGGPEGDIPVPGDYDGDRRADIAVWRPGTGIWYILNSTTGYTNYISRSWGGGWVGDVPVPADYDGDGRKDIAVFRPSGGMWYILTSGSGFDVGLTYQWGGSGDQPVLNDYDGDGRIDLTVWRPSTGVWYIKTSSSGYSNYLAVTFGGGWVGDMPIGQLQPRR